MSTTGWSLLSRGRKLRWNSPEASDLLPCSASPFCCRNFDVADRYLFSRVPILPDDNTGQYYRSKSPGECQHNNEGSANNGQPHPKHQFALAIHPRQHRYDAVTSREGSGLMKVPALLCRKTFNPEVSRRIN